LRRMGGLKNELPITYWTFLIGAIAIAGVPGLAGFFSKDEILFRTFASGHTILWSIGLITSLLTAIYMFRIVFLAFHGPSPSATAAQVGPSPPAAHHSHLHDAPGPMAIALIVLAIGSVLAGYVGLPAALGGGDWFARFLEPSFHVEAAHEGAERSIELTLMLVSSGVALAGIGIAAYFFLRNRSAADAMAGRFAGLHNLLLNKYFVDEIYDASIVQPIRIVSQEGLWKVVDARIIDGAVNGTGLSVTGWSQLLRRLQTGSVRAYAASLFIGVVAILGYYLWR